ncbi:MAG TPA: LTA synthase family protein [Candidatus Polarisedimenticolaceae bacterium]
MGRFTGSRMRLGVGLAAFYLAIGVALRSVLLVKFGGGPVGVLSGATLLALGALNDLLTVAVALSPVGLLLAWCPPAMLRSAVVRGALAVGLGGAITFGAFTEYFFFEEFDARFNHIALDYLLHPKEVFVNIWDSYNVPAFVAWAAAAGLVLGLLAWRRPRRGVERLGLRQRLLASAAVFGGAFAAAMALRAIPDAPTTNRVRNEIATNGLESLIHAFRSARLPYDAYYRTLPAREAHERAAKVLRHRPPQPDPDGGFRMDAAVPVRVVPDHAWDVVVILEESLGSEFISALGRPGPELTPGFDRWSREGTLLTNLVATGTRTVRGLEGTLASFVPLPGDAILKRDLGHPVATLGAVMRHAGYRTVFYYGGWGAFDSMKPFFLHDGWEEFDERDSFPGDAFSTIWGVADEYVFDALLGRQRRAAREGERLFATVMSTSNHKPFDVPDRPAAVPSRLRNREAAVAYSDWALANYLDRAGAEGLLDHTLVLVVGDHGARVYGREEIPAASYRIPALFLAPGDAWKGRRIDRLASQIDLAPTLLGILGLDTDAPFFGEDVASLPADGGRAFLHHNLDFGILTDTALVTLGLRRSDACYERSGRASDVFTRVEDCDTRPDLVALRDDAVAVYQTASDLLEEGDYDLPEDDPAITPPRSPVSADR